MKEFLNSWLSCLHLLNRSMKRVREEISILWRPDTVSASRHAHRESKTTLCFGDRK